MARYILALFTCVVFAVPAFAAELATSYRTARGKIFLMCDAETSNGVCDNASGDLIAKTSDWSILTFEFSEVGSGSTCDIYAAVESSDTTNLISDLDLSDNANNKINSTALSASLDKITFTDADFEFVWVSCTIAGTSATVRMRVSNPVSDSRWFR